MNYFKRGLIQVLFLLVALVSIGVTGTAEVDSEVYTEPEYTEGAFKYLNIQGEYEEGVVLVKYREEQQSNFMSIKNFFVKENLFAGLSISSYEELSMAAFEEESMLMSVSTQDINWFKAYVNEDASVQDVLIELAALENVEYAEPNYLYYTSPMGDYEILSEEDLTSDPSLLDQYYLDTIDIDAARDHLESIGIDPGGSRDVVVAVIDSGVDYTHPDLAANMWVNSGEVPGNGIDDDGNGYIDDIYGVNTVSDARYHSGDPMDDHGHGTHVAGIIGATGDNGIGIRGVADNVRIMAIKAGQASGVLTSSDIAEGIDYAVEKGADVINMSFGSYAKSNIIEDSLAVAFSTSVLIAAAGNNGYINLPHPSGRDMYPAAFPWVVGVMASDGTNLAGFSNFDFLPEDSHEYSLVAPGVDIISTLPNGQYAKWDGTSMSAPIVSGIAALLRSKFNDEWSHSSRFIMGQLIGTAPAEIPVPPLYKTLYGVKWNAYNQVDAYLALTTVPKPDLTYFEYYIFDDEEFSDVNDGDGTIDAGETIHLAIVIRNHWGRGEDVNVTLNTISAGGVENPYVTLDTSSVNYGAVGSFSSDDNGFIYNDDDKIIGVENPFVFTVDADTPNEHLIMFNVDIDGLNGLDPLDTERYNFQQSSFLLQVRSGQEVPNLISEDMTLTNDKYWIIENSTKIEAGVTVDVEPGTQIQFWSNEEETVYAEKAMAYLEVEGTLNIIGTADQPIDIFPSGLMSMFEVKIYEDEQGTINMQYVNVTNPKIRATVIDHSYFTQEQDQIWFRYLSDGEVHDGYWEPTHVHAERISNSIFYKLTGYYDNNQFSISGELYNNLFDSNNMQVNIGTAENNVYLNNFIYQEYQWGDREYWTSSGYANQDNSNTSINVQNVFRNELTGTTYIVASSNIQNNAMRNYAKYLGGDFAIFNSNIEKEFVTSHLNGAQVTIGLEYDYFTQEYNWIDGNPTDVFVNINDDNYSPTYASYANGEFYEDTSSYFLIEVEGYIYVNDIILDETEITIGDQTLDYQIPYTLDPFTSSKEDVLWETSDDQIVSVSSVGVINPVGLGTATITVKTVDDVVLKTITVNVVTTVLLDSIVIKNEITQLNVSEYQRLILNFFPTNTTERAVVWSSSDELIATVDELGVVKGVSEGTVTITATSTDGLTSASTDVSVVVPVDSIEFEEDFLQFANTEIDILLPLEVNPTNATNQNLVWVTSNKNVVTFDENGLMQPHGIGTAIIRVYAENTQIYDDMIVSISESVLTDMNVIDVKETGYDHNKRVFALMDNGDIWSWGSEASIIPTKMNIDNVTAINSAENRLFAVKADGSLWRFDYNSFQKVQGIEDVVAVTVTDSFFVALKTDGTLWGQGQNDYGQLADMAVNYIDVPMQLDVADVVIEVVSTRYATVFLTDANEVKMIKNGTVTTLTQYPDIIDIEKSSWGYGMILESANGDFTRVSIWSNSMDDWSWYFDQANQQFDVESAYYNNNYSDVYAIITVDKELYTQGNNNMGVLGVGHTNYVNNWTKVALNNVEKFVSGYQNSYAITTDGELYIWGNNNNGQIGDFTTIPRYAPFKVLFGVQQDSIQPEIESSLPKNNSIEFDVNDQIIIDFSEAIYPSYEYTSILLRDSNGNVISIKKTIDMDKLIIEPINPLKYNEDYTLVINNSAIRDMFRNSNMDSLVLNFSTEDLIYLSRRNVLLDINQGPQALVYTLNPDYPSELVWTSLDESVVTVEDGVLTPVGPGYATVLVSSSDGKYAKEINVRVENIVPITSLNIVEETMIVGSNSDLQATLEVGPQDYNDDIIWTSQDLDVALVDEFGFITGVHDGTTVVKASTKDGLVFDTVIVTVIESVELIDISQEFVVFNTTDSLDSITYNIYPLTATDQSVVWESSDSNVISIDDLNNMTIEGEGNVVLRVTSSNPDIYDEIIVFVSDVVDSDAKVIDVATFAYYSETSVYALFDNGDVFTFGQGRTTPVKINVSDIASLHGHGYRTYAISKDGNTVYNLDWGNATVNNELSNRSIVKFSTAASNTIYQTADGRIYGFGNNDYGQIADKSINYVQQMNPVEITGLDNIEDFIMTENAMIALTTNGDVYYRGGFNNDDVFLKFDELSNVESIRNVHSYYEWDERRFIATDQDGVITLVTMENEIYTQNLSVTIDGNIIDVATNGSNDQFVVYLTDLGEVWTSGSNGYGQLGNGSFDYIDFETPQKIELENIVKIFVEKFNVIAINNLGEMFIWGSDENNQIPDLINSQNINIPTKVYFGMVQDMEHPFIVSQTPTADDVDVNVDINIEIDFNEYIEEYNNQLYRIKLIDSSGNEVSSLKELNMNQLVISPLGDLKYGETYRVYIPSSVLIDKFNNMFESMEFSFSTAKFVEVPYTNYVLDINTGAEQILYTLHPEFIDGYIWESADDTIVTVDQNGLATPQSVGNTQIYLKSSDGEYIQVFEITSVIVIRITDINIIEETLIVNAQENVTATLEVLPVDYNEQIIWISDNENIATVDEFGNIYGIHDGTTSITASTKDGLILDTVLVTVLEAVESIAITNDYLVINTLDSGTVIDYEVYPTTATDQSVSWESSNEAIISFDDNNNMTVHSEGQVVLRVNSNSSEHYDEIIVFVSDQFDETYTIKQTLIGGSYSQTTVYILFDNGEVYFTGNSEGYYYEFPTKIDIEAIKSLEGKGNKVYGISLDGNTVYHLRGTYTYDYMWLRNKDVISISTNDNVTLFQTSDGKIYGYGDNGNGQLADLTVNWVSETTPVEIPGMANSMQFDVLNYATVFLSPEGDLYYRGTSNQDDIAVKVGGITDIIKIEPVRGYSEWGDDEVVAYTSDGEIYIVRINDSITITQIDTSLIPETVVKVTTTGDTNRMFIYLTDTGNVYVQGQNPFGMLGVGHDNHVTELTKLELENIVSIHAYKYNTVAVNALGELFIWGNDENYQIPDMQNQVSRNEPIKVYFGMFDDNELPTIEATTPSQNETDISVDQQIVIDYNEYVKENRTVEDSSELIRIVLKDSNNNIVPTTKLVHLDKLYITPLTDLKYGETYTVSIPSYVLADVFDNPLGNFEYSFETADFMELTYDYYKVDINKGNVQMLFSENIDFDQSLIWSSLDESIATVNQEGLLTPTGLGSTQILVSSEDGFYNKIIDVDILEITYITSISFASEYVRINVGNSKVLTPIVNPTNYNELLYWSSNNAEVASVNNEGIVTAISNGTATITAANPAGDVVGSMTIEVITPVTGISIEEDFVPFVLNDINETIQYQIEPLDATYTEVEWQTSDERIAYVNESNELVKVSAGTVTIRVKAAGTEMYDDVVVTLSENTVLDANVVDALITEQYSYALLDDGTVWVWGQNILLPIKVNLENVVQITGNYNDQIYARLSDGTVKRMYRNNVYDVSGISDVVDISAHRDSVVALKTDGTIWAWGNNDYKILSDLDINYIGSPVLVYSDGNVEDIALTRTTLITVNSDGTVSYRGLNNNGYTVIDDVYNITHVREMYGRSPWDQSYAALYDTDGIEQYVYSSSGSFYLYGIPQIDNETVVDFDRAYDSVYLLTESGKLFVQGNNDRGQLGLGHTDYINTFTELALNNVVKAMGDFENGLFITAEGDLYLTGYNNVRQVPNLTTVDVYTPYKVVFGINYDTIEPYIEGLSLDAEWVGEAEGEVTFPQFTEIEINQDLVIDFSKALIPAGQFIYAAVKDQNGNAVSAKFTMDLDKLYIDIFGELDYESTYYIYLPSSSLRDVFNNYLPAFNIYFSTEEILSVDKTSYKVDIEDGTRVVTYNVNEAYTGDITFTSLNPDVVSVDPVTGLLTPNSLGTTQVVISTDNGTYTEIVDVTIIETIEIQSINIIDEHTYLGKDEQLQIDYEINPVNTNEDFTFVSLDTSIATVSETGVIKGLTSGITTVTLYNNDQSIFDSIVVEVIVAVDSIEIAEEFYIIPPTEVGFTVPYELLPIDATVQDVVWTSSDDAIITVDAEGNFVIGNVGTAKMRVTTMNGTYDEVLVSVSDTIDDTLKVVDAGIAEYGTDQVVYAVMSDGSLWSWGKGYVGTAEDGYQGQHLVPTKLDVTDVVSIEAGNYGVAIIKTDGTVWALGNNYICGNQSNGNCYEFTQVPDLIDIVDVKMFDNTRLALKSDGTVWGWGTSSYGQLGFKSDNWIYSPVQINGVSEIKEIGVSSDVVFLLNELNELYYLGSRDYITTPTKLDIGDPVYHISNGGYYFLYLHGNDTENLKVDYIYYYDMGIRNNYTNYTIALDDYVSMDSSRYEHSLLTSSRTYMWGDNNYSKLGVGHDESVDRSNPQEINLENIVKLKLSARNGLAITENGEIYVWGDNLSGQLVDFSSIPSNTPKLIPFGFIVDDVDPFIESTYPLDGELLSVNEDIVIDFNEAILGDQWFYETELRDSSGNIVSIEKEIVLDKLIIRPINPLNYSETYTLSTNPQGISDLFTNNALAINMTFTTEAENVIASEGDTELLVRDLWTPNRVRDEFAEFTANGGHSAFTNNAILNNLYDPNPDNWLTFSAQQNENTMYIAGNYWGSKDAELVEKHILDFDDYQSLGDIIETPFLLEANEMMYPHVTDILLSNDTAFDLRQVGAENVTITVKFNRDMDMTVPAGVYFGPDYPYTDYKVPGEWVDARTWVGLAKITPLTGDGKQFFRVRDAIAAEDSWLKVGDDDGRFMFEIISTGTESMNLQANGSEGRVELTWMQDDFDLLAGYNIYRSTSMDGTYERINDSLISKDILEYDDYNVEPAVIYYYKFTVLQTDLTESDYSNVAAGAAYDTIAPTVVHNPVTESSVYQEIFFEVYAQDNNVLESVKLFYRYIGEETYTELQMISTDNYKYTTKLSADLVILPGLEYYVEVSDGLTIVNRGSESLPYVVHVEDKPTIETITPGIGVYQGGDSITITGTNFREGVRVFFSTLEGLNLELIDENTIKVDTPTHFPTKVDVKVVNPSGDYDVKFNYFEYFSDDTSISMPTVKAGYGHEIVIPVQINNVNGLLAADITFEYDPNLLTFVEYDKGNITGRFSVAANTSEYGRLRFSMANSTSITGGGDILYLTFKVTETPYEYPDGNGNNIEVKTAYINIAEVTLNSNSINTTIVDGVVNISDVYMVSGNVTYYSNDTSINGVDIFLDGSNEYHVTTDADGEYSIQEVVTDDYTMTATKNDDVNGITAFDATMVLRSSVGLESFDILQTIAADVNSDGVVNSMDAAQILQFVAGIRVLPFEGTGVIWKFNPEEYSYIDIEQNMFNQDLKAILVGDVTGNYSPSSDTASLFDTDGVLKIGTFTETESQLLVPIEINYYDYDLYSFETTIMFDHGVTVHDIVFAKELEQCFIVTNTQNDNMIRIAVACTNPVDINGIAFQIIFNKGVEMPDQFHMIVQDTYLNEYENILELTSVYNGYLNPDLNNDGIIDENDIKLMVEDYNMTYNEADISIYDFNSDGIIDIYDIIKNNSTE